MPEVLPRDVLLRVGGRTLARYGVSFVAGPGLGRAEAKETFARADGTTCATYIDRSGLVRRAAANVLRVEWVDLDGDGIRETPGLLLEGARTNLCLRSEELDNAAWANSGAVAVTPNTDVAPDGTTTADTLTDDDAGAFEGRAQSFTVANDSLSHVFALFVKKTVGATNTFGINMSLSGGTPPAGSFPRLNTNSGVVAGGLLNTQALSVGNYWLFFSTITNNSQGNTALSVTVFPATGTNSGSNPGTDSVTATGSAVVWGAQLEKAVFPSSYIKTTSGTVARAGDLLTLPVGFGPVDLTILYRLARPRWADATGDIGGFPEIMNLGVTADPNARLEAYFGITSRQLNARTGDSASNAVRTIPAGTSLAFISQHKDAASLPAVAVDVGDGNGLTAFDTGAAPFTAFFTPVLRVGGSGGVASFGGVLVEAVVARGLFSRAEMMAIP
jgi:hypothetical protein